MATMYKTAKYQGDGHYIVFPKFFRSYEEAFAACDSTHGWEILTSREAKACIASGRFCWQTRRSYRYTPA